MVDRVTIYDNLKERGLNLWDALSRSADEYFSSKPVFSPSQPFDMQYYTDGNYLPPLQDSVQRDVGNAVAKGVLDTVTDPVGYVQDLYYGIADPAVSAYENTGASLPYYGNAALQRLRGDDSTESLNIADNYSANAITSLGLLGLGIADVLPSGKVTTPVKGLLDKPNVSNRITVKDDPTATGLLDDNAGGKVVRSGREVPAAIGVEEPITRGDLLSNVYPRPLQEMEAKYLDRKELLPKKILTPEDLEGQASVKAYGDRTDAGLDLIEINGQKLDEAVRLLGGKDYMRSLAQQIDGSSWASAAGKISLLSNEIARLRKQGFDTNLMYTAMAGASDKFSNMLSEAVVNQIPYSKILKKDAKVFDNIMQNIIDAHNAKLKRNQSKIPNWVGIQNKNLKQYLNDGGGTALRVPFIDEISKKTWYNKGFPDIASTRFAITSPDLVHASTLDSGHVISSTTGKVLKDMKTNHPSYPQGIEGVLLGGLEIPLPAHIAWKDWMTKRFPEHHKAGLLSEVKLLPKDLMSFDYSAVSQKHTPEWVDEAMAYTEMMKKYR